ncbi:hypothetical protein Ancab_039806 [Ancistrocladus abbreviatus]
MVPCCSISVLCLNLIVEYIYGQNEAASPAAANLICLLYYILLHHMSFISIELIYSCMMKAQWQMLFHSQNNCHLLITCIFLGEENIDDELEVLLALIHGVV